MYKIFSFKHIENKHDVYRGKKCIKNSECIKVTQERQSILKRKK